MCVILFPAMSGVLGYKIWPNRISVLKFLIRNLLLLYLRSAPAFDLTPLVVARHARIE